MTGKIIFYFRVALAQALSSLRKMILLHAVFPQTATIQNLNETFKKTLFYYQIDLDISNILFIFLQILGK